MYKTQSIGGGGRNISLGAKVSMYAALAISIILYLWVVYASI